jgi:SAM-dependent methyltransferase
MVTVMPQVQTGPAMESVTNCEICGSSDSRVIWRQQADTLTNVVCNACGLVYASPRPSPDALAKFYEEDYRIRYSLSARPTEAFVQSCERQAAIRIDFLKERFNSPNAIDVLEIGCGVGAFLGGLKKNYKTGLLRGIEPDKNYGGFGQESYGVQIDAGMFNERSRFDRQFDAICFFHVLEHLPKPAEFLSQVRDLLKEDGFLFFEVPNVWCPAKGYLERFFQDAHLYQFSPRTITRLLAKCGLTVSAIKAERDALLVIAKPNVAVSATWLSLPNDSPSEIVTLLKRWRIYHFAFGWFYTNVLEKGLWYARRVPYKIRKILDSNTHL